MLAKWSTYKSTYQLAERYSIKPAEWNTFGYADKAAER